MKDLKIYLGIGLLVLSFIAPFLSFFVAAMNISIAAKATIIGLLTVGVPEVLAVLAVALLGKEAFDLLLSKFRGVFRHLAPRGSVSRLRYRIGLLLFILPIIPTYIMGYAPQFLPDDSTWRLPINIAADVMFISSLFVLGGDFWDKLRALFLYDAKVQFPNA